MGEWLWYFFLPQIFKCVKIILMRNLPKILLAVFIVLWIWLAINPLYRFDWFLENIVFIIFLPTVILSYYKFRLSDFAYILIFIFAVLHLLGSHYTYGATPWGNWISDIFGWGRNNYDRITHFLYAVLMTPVAVEIFHKYLPQNKLVRSFLVFGVLVSVGAIYEIVEFIVGVLVEPEKGLGFLGFQGDIWDTQKDMALQSLGAILGLILFRKR